MTTHPTPIGRPRSAALVLLLLGILSRPGAAVITDHEGWFQMTATGPIAGPARIFLELQPRIGEKHSSQDVGMRALLGRAALGIDVLPHWSLWAGYGYTPTYDPERDEHRAFQQLLYENILGPFPVSVRTRTEERFLQHAPIPAYRLRSQVRATYPLPPLPSLSLVLADEIFVHLNTVRTGPVSGFDQNRLFAGVSQQLMPHVRLELDYLNQVVNARHGAEDILRHSGFLQLAFNW